jgi:hypothetical protein
VSRDGDMGDLLPFTEREWMMFMIDSRIDELTDVDVF